MKNILKLILITIVLTGCQKEDFNQPNFKIFTLNDLSGEWFASENRINNESYYNVIHKGDTIDVIGIDTNQYNINVVDSRSISILNKLNYNNYILLRR